jgi:hypothetical protein
MPLSSFVVDHVRVFFVRAIVFFWFERWRCWRRRKLDEEGEENAVDFSRIAMHSRSDEVLIMLDFIVSIQDVSLQL